MKYTKLLSMLAVATVVSFTSCQNDAEIAQSNQDEQVSDVAIAKIHEMGFSTRDVKRVEEGYLVEGDIILTDSDLDQAVDRKLLRVGTEEQYHTSNLVKGLPRVITVRMDSKLPSSYVAALDEAIARYNAQNLTITFRRVTSNANITMVRGNGSYLASAGFPTASGEPYSQVKINSRYIGNNPNTKYLATILAHEIGHCIGFRHTDYMDRSYSCGGSTANEGASTVGAIHIPGTPTTQDPNSWMLACIGTGQDRPFNSNDRTALNYLY